VGLRVAALGWGEAELAAAAPVPVALAAAAWRVAAPVLCWAAAAGSELLARGAGLRPVRAAPPHRGFRPRGRRWPGARAGRCRTPFRWPVAAMAVRRLGAARYPAAGAPAPGHAMPASSAAARATGPPRAGWASGRWAGARPMIAGIDLGAGWAAADRGAAFCGAGWHRSAAALTCAGFPSFRPRHGEGHHAAQPRIAWRKVSAAQPSPIACRAKARFSGPIRSTAAMPSRRAARSGGKALPKSFSSAWVAPSIIIAAGRRAA